MWGGDSFDNTGPHNNVRPVNRQSNFATNYSGSNYSYGGGNQANVSSENISKICDLSPGIIKDKVVGVTIAKEEPRSFPSKKDPSNERHVMNFTLRDSPTDFINVTCWGNQEFIQELGMQFHIGDVVEITNVGVQSKPMDGSDEKFHPWTPSTFQLNVSDKRSTVCLYTGWDATELLALSHIPVKPNNDFCTLGDILNNGANLSNDNVNLLAAIRSVGPVKEVNSKTNKQLRRCEVKLMDETAPSFALVLWDAEQIGLAQNWTPKDSVIFAADVRVKFDDFRKTMVATATSKTIFTINPNTQEAHTLYQHAQTVDLPAEDRVQQTLYVEPSQNMDLSSIKNVYTVAQCREKQVIRDGGGGTEHCILYATVTQMDIDSDNSCVVFRCAKCKQRLDQMTNTCNNQDCPQGSRFDLDWESTEKTANFEIRISLSDHTGTLDPCYVNGDICQTWLQITVEEYLCLVEEQKTRLKWEYLLEQCKVYIRMSLPTYDYAKSTIRILSIEKANPEEAAKYLK